MSRLFSLLPVALMTVMFLGCGDGDDPKPADDKKKEETTSTEVDAEELAEAKQEAEEAGLVNVMCPIEFHPVDAENGGTYEWEGKTVGFCCPGCDTRFAKLSDEEKQAALDKAAEKAKEEATES